MGQKKSWENNNLNFRLACDQVMHLETAANLCASWRQENIFFLVMAAKCFVCSSFELGGITKHLMTGPTETVSFISPQPSNIKGFWKQNSMFPLGPVIKCSVFRRLAVHSKAYMCYIKARWKLQIFFY